VDLIKIINRSTSSELKFDLQIFPMLVVGKVNASLPTDMSVIELGVNKIRNWMVQGLSKHF